MTVTTDTPTSAGVRSARMREARRNHDYFNEHAKELFERYPDRWLLIHSGGEVSAFNDLTALIRERNALDDVKRGGAIIERRRAGAWIL